MGTAALAVAAPEAHLAQQEVAVAGIAQRPMLHDARDVAIAALDNDDVPLMEIAAAELIGRKRARLVTHRDYSASVAFLFEPGSAARIGQVGGALSFGAGQMRQFVGFFSL